jgi:hypothetical protein
MILTEIGDRSMSASVIESIFAYTLLRKRQFEVAFRERELLLTHLLEQGTSKRAVRSLATMLLHIVRLLDLKVRRKINLSEIEPANLQWKSDPGHSERCGLSFPCPTPGRSPHFGEHYPVPAMEAPERPVR